MVPLLLRFAGALVLFGVGALLFRSLRPRGQPGPELVGGWTVMTSLVLWVTRRSLERVADGAGFGGDSNGSSMRMLLRQLAAAVPVDEVASRLAESLGRSTHSARTEVRIALDGDDRWVRVWPPTAPPPGESLTMQIRHMGSPVGEVVLDTDVATRSEQRRLDQLTGIAGLAMNTVKKTWELRRRVADLELVTEQLRTSQTRLREARSTEQARLQAEVDARVVPVVRSAADVVGRLTAAEVGLPLPEQTLTALAAASNALAGALDSLRSIARGIFPPRLDEDGLPASLRSSFELTGEPASIDIVGNPARLHAQPDVERCLYFCIVTLLRAGAADTGHGRRVQLRFEGASTGFVVALPSRASVPEPVFLAVRDRIEAFDGELNTSRSTAGVLVRGAVPMASGSAGRGDTEPLQHTESLPSTGRSPAGRQARIAGSRSPSTTWR